MRIEPPTSRPASFGPGVSRSFPSRLRKQSSAPRFGELSGKDLPFILATMFVLRFPVLATLIGLSTTVGGGIALDRYVLRPDKPAVIKDTGVPGKALELTGLLQDQRRSGIPNSQVPHLLNFCLETSNSVDMRIFSVQSIDGNVQGSSTPSWLYTKALGDPNATVLGLAREATQIFIAQFKNKSDPPEAVKQLEILLEKAPRPIDEKSIQPALPGFDELRKTMLNELQPSTDSI